MARWSDSRWRLVSVGRRRLRRGGRKAATRTARLTVASICAYLMAGVIFPGTQHLLAPLTALLVVQLTPVSLLASGLERVVSVVSGVSIATLFSATVELSWWSLGLVIALGLLIGQALRLGDNLLEVPISAMLVLGVGSFEAESAAWERISETLVGAGVGVLVNLVFPPRITAGDAGDAIDELADDLARLLDRAGEELADRSGNAELVDRASGWLGESRRITHGIPRVGSALLGAEESRRLNLRAVGTADPGPGLRQGMEAIEHSAVAVRSMFRSLHDAARDGSPFAGDVGLELRTAVAVALHELADALHAFGDLVRVEAAQGYGQEREMAQVHESLDQLHETRARVTELMLADDDPVRRELDFALLGTVRRLLSEMDLEERARRQPGPTPRPMERLRQLAATPVPLHPPPLPRRPRRRQP